MIIFFPFLISGLFLKPHFVLIIQLKVQFGSKKDDRSGLRPCQEFTTFWRKRSFGTGNKFPDRTNFKVAALLVFLAQNYPSFRGKFSDVRVQISTHQSVKKRWLRKCQLK